jgi:hypothetical protein
MSHKNKKVKHVSFWTWVNRTVVLGGAIGIVFACVGFFLDIKESIEKLESTMVELDNTMIEVKAELRKTSDLLNADLSWRYLDQNDPTRKRLVPRYHPDTRTLEFVDKRTFDSSGVRKP